jgi:hypothetical protein
MAGDRCRCERLEPGGPSMCRASAVGNCRIRNNRHRITRAPMPGLGQAGARPALVRRAPGPYCCCCGGSVRSSVLTKIARFACSEQVCIAR